ncbi:MAG TPA: hypothetical protein VK528_08830 [Flavobacterium sp.]|nr:hypothetical protein [Flavobacterium sp.]
MKKVMMLVAVLGFTAASFAQEAPAKPVKHSRKHKAEMKAEATKADAKAVKADAPKAVDAKAKK